MGGYENPGGPETPSQTEGRGGFIDPRDITFTGTVNLTGSGSGGILTSLALQEEEVNLNPPGTYNDLPLAFPIVYLRSSGDIVLTGVAPNATGHQVFVLVNISGHIWTLKHEDAGSQSRHRFHNFDLVDYVLNPGSSVIIHGSTGATGTGDRWIPILGV